MDTVAAPSVDLGSRNTFAGRRDTPFRSYVGLVVAGGLTAVVLAVLAVDPRALLGAGPAFWLVVALLVAGEVRPLFTAGSKDVNGIAVSPAFLFALMLGYGLPVALLGQALAVGGAGIVRRDAAWRVAFNVSQYTLSWAGAGAVLSLVSGHPPVEGVGLELHAAELAAALAAAVTYFVLNQLLVVLALSLKTGERVWALLRPDLGHEVLTNGALLTLAPLVVLAMAAGVAFVPLLLPPLLAVYTVASIALDRERRALTDVLTGLANRERLAEDTAAALTPADARVALLLLDLDRFKEVNDTLGHHVGDRLLQVVADRLAAAVRPEDTVARLGGDEFAVLLTDCADPDDALETARRLRGVLAEPILLEGVLLDVVASIGVACLPDDGTDLDELLQRADVAMYLAKGSGSQVERYDAERDHNTTSRLALLGELRRALREGELVLHYQPKVQMADGRLTGVEALVRWQHPERGLLPPDEFVPAAERSGLIGALTAWVVDEALTQLSRWRDDGLTLRVAVNISARDLADEHLVDVVAAALERHGVPAAYLQLEVTEGSLLADPARTALVLQRLDALGVPLSLDDFGTGWSSLSHLRRLPVQEIKVDRTFVQRIDVDARDLAIVRSVVDLAEGLGMHVVAEGVETQEAWERLKALGCGTAQGWLISRAEPAEKLTPWLQERISGVPLAPVPAQPTAIDLQAAHPK